METFFQSVARSFTGNRAALPQVQWAILGLLALVLLVQVVGVARRALARRSEFHRLCATRGLPEADVRFAEALAAGAAAEPLQLVTHLDLFERATAQALHQAAAAPPPAAAEATARIRRLRHALGFDRLPTHTPLLSTRELAPGTALEVASQHGTVAEVTETTLTVELREPPAVAAGQQVSLGLVHAREARYALGCLLRRVQAAGEGGWLLRFSHDEAPARIQQREYARVRLGGTMSLRPVSAGPGPSHLALVVPVELEDLSGGGAKVTCHRALPVGLLALATFAVGSARFADVRTVVLACAATPGPDGLFRAQLEFTGRAGAERERLVAALTQLELGEQAASRA